MESAQLAPNNVSLLRADQIEEMEGEREALEAKLGNPHVQDKGAVREQLKRMSRQLEAQRPKAYEGADIDRAVKREAELRDQIGQGMLSHEEMRKCPPGAVDRHRRWERDNKARIAEWQNIRRRLNAGNDDREVASIEAFRPTASAMSMDGALIPGRQFFNVEQVTGPTVTFNDEEIAVLRAQAPDVALRLASYTNDQRAEVKKVVRSFIDGDQEQAA